MTARRKPQLQIDNLLAGHELSLKKLSAETAKMLMKKPDALNVYELAESLLLLRQKLIELDDKYDFNNTSRSITERYDRLVKKEEILSRQLKEEEALQHQREIRKIQATGSAIAFSFLVPAAIANLAEKILGQKSRMVPIVAYTAFLAGVGIAFRKPIGRKWNSVKNDVRQLPNDVRNNFCLYYIKNTVQRLPSSVQNNHLIYYVKETAKEKSKEFGKKFRLCSKEVLHQTARIKTFSNRKLRKLCGNANDHGPPTGPF